MFYCYSVPTGLLITRHKGKVEFHGNSPIQGTAGDLMRIFLPKAVDLTNNKYKGKTSFLSMIHDEHNTFVHKDYLPDFARDMLKLSYFKHPSWQVPMLCEFEIGKSWGDLYPFEFDEGGKLIPSFD